MLNHEVHPWKWYGKPGARTLMIGTFPPTRKNWAYDFFYPNKHNLFWKIIAEVAGRSLEYYHGDEAVMERKALLDQLGIVISDMGYIITRENGNSLDENLVLIEPMEILDILDQYPGIQTILLTSSSGKVSALRWFLSYLKTRQHPGFKIKAGPKPLYSTLEVQGRTIKVVVLFSPSKRASNRIPFSAMCEMYGREINASLL